MLLNIPEILTAKNSWVQSVNTAKVEKPDLEGDGQGGCDLRPAGSARATWHVPNVQTECLRL